MKHPAYCDCEVCWRARGEPLEESQCGDHLFPGGDPYSCGLGCSKPPGHLDDHGYASTDPNDGSSDCRPFSVVWLREAPTPAEGAK